MASNGRLAWLVIGIVSTVAALAATSGGVWFLTSFRPDLQDRLTTESYAWDAKALTVESDSGSISVRQGRAGHVEIVRDLRWTKFKPSVSEHWDGRALNVASHCPPSGFGETCEVNYAITVPPGVIVTASTDSGDVTAIGVDGRLDLTTLSGNVFLARAQSTQVVASSDSGDVQLGFTVPPGSVQATTASGDVRIEVPPGGSYAVHPTADSGNTSVEVSNDPSAPRSIVATSDSGDVTIRYN